MAQLFRSRFFVVKHRVQLVILVAAQVIEVVRAVSFGDIGQRLLRLQICEVDESTIDGVLLFIFHDAMH
jgi:hypothetical protein